LQVVLVEVVVVALVGIQAPLTNPVQVVWVEAVVVPTVREMA
jgi:hypothetical protein